MSVFHKIREALAQRQVSRAKTFDDLVAQLAAGERVSEKACAELLEQTGRDVAELEAAVQAIRQRREKADAYKALPSVKAELVGIRAAIAEAFRDREAFLKQSNEKLAGLGGKESELLQRQQRLTDIGNELLASASDEARAGVDAAEAVIRTLNDRKSGHWSASNDAATEAAKLRRQLANALAAPRHDAVAKADAERLPGEIAALDREGAQHDQASDKIDRVEMPAAKLALEAAVEKLKTS